MMQEPSPHQGTVITQQQNPEDSEKSNHEIYMTGEEMFFQTQNCNYDIPLDTDTSGASTNALNIPLTISNIPIEPLPKMAKDQIGEQENTPKQPIIIASWTI